MLQVPCKAILATKNIFFLSPSHLLERHQRCERASRNLVIFAVFVFRGSQGKVKVKTGLLQMCPNKIALDDVHGKHVGSLRAWRRPARLFDVSHALSSRVPRRSVPFRCTRRPDVAKSRHNTTQHSAEGEICRVGGTC